MLKARGEDLVLDESVFATHLDCKHLLGVGASAIRFLPGLNVSVMVDETAFGYCRPLAKHLRRSHDYNYNPFRRGLATEGTMHWRFYWIVLRHLSLWDAYSLLWIMESGYRHHCSN